MNHFYHYSNFGDGFFSFPNVYRALAKAIPANGQMVEVGSWKGQSAVCMAVELENLGKSSVKFYCVDTWLGSQEEAHQKDVYVQTGNLYQLFLANISPVRHLITPIRENSVVAAKLFADHSSEIVFIDACHEYECVKEDIAAWLPKVKPGGILAGHDYIDDFPGVKKAVDEFFSDQIQAVEGCWIYRVK